MQLVILNRLLLIILRAPPVNDRRANFVYSHMAKQCARERAEDIQRNLDPKHPSFAKSMVLSHVGGCFLLV
ncbi:hypothetical protein GIB67_017644 [Kingdonia uniflora]|uniref:Uncharacterized protein n=1 Tax=Kingdonia uniflora TaxID=39325 RepID=A0A7J7LN09_9MAGN|nr:hypothetical protein GIB67_017644 [Kingdonia uniflora]